MFLANLSIETKKLFLELAKYAIKADLKVQDKEREMLGSYCYEMQMTIERYEPEEKLENILAKIKGICSVVEINMIMVEIIALLLSDNEYLELEKKFVEKLKTYFELGDEQIDQFVNVNEEIIEVYKKMYKVVGCDLSM